MKLTNYSEKSLSSKRGQPREKAARKAAQPWKGSALFWHLVKSGFRKTSKILNFDVAFCCYVGDQKYSLSVFQINAYLIDDQKNAFALFEAITATNKTKPRNKKTIIARFAPICADYPMTQWEAEEAA